MKKVVNLNPIEEIKASEITTKDTLIARNGEKIFAVIYHAETGWRWFSENGGNGCNWDNLFEMLSDLSFMEYCELYKVE